MAWGRLPHLIWGPGCSSPCLSIWGSELLPPMAAQGLEGLPDKAAGRTKGTSEIQFFSMGGIIYGPGEMPWLPQQSPGRGWYFQLKAEGQSAAMPTSEGSEHTAKSHLPPNHWNVPRWVTKSSCWNCAALWWPSLLPQLYPACSTGGSLCLGYSPCLLQGMARWFLWMWAPQIVPHCCKHLEMEL